MTEMIIFTSVEDEPSKEILIKIIEYVNETHDKETPSLPKLVFEEGTPWIAAGYGDIKTKHLPAMKKMAKENDICSIILTDLDQETCAPALVRNWLAIEADASLAIPPKLIFRVAVRETESWLMADKKKFARFMKMPEVNVPQNPDELRDPKKKIFEFINQYCRKQHGRMLPSAYSFIGPEYNSSLCEFIQNQWRPQKAMLVSDSLKRTIHSLERVMQHG